MNNQHDKLSEQDPNCSPDLQMGEASTSVSLTSFMAAVAFFFIGLLLTGEASVQIRLRVPLFFLFVSAFGFLYATLVYTNATGEIARLKSNSFARQMSVANVLSEYFGVYGLVFATPVVVLGYSPDAMLSVAVLVVSSGALLFYHLAGFSILERYTSALGMGLLLLAMIGLSGAGFIAFYLDAVLAHYIFYSLLFVLLIGMAWRSLSRAEQ